MSVVQQEIDEFVKNVVVPKRAGKRKVRRRASGAPAPTARREEM
jgi:hypothetical protein